MKVLAADKNAPLKRLLPAFERQRISLVGIEPPPDSNNFQIFESTKLPFTLIEYREWEGRVKKLVRGAEHVSIV